MSAFLGAYKRCLDVLVRVESALAMVAMAFIILINAAGIFARYCLHRPILWVHELTILTGTWLIYVGIGILFARQGDICWELLVDKLPSRVRRAIEFIIDGIVLAFLALLTYLSYAFLPFVSMSGAMLSFDLGVPDVYFYAPVGVGAVLIFLPVLYKTLARLTSTEQS